MRSRARVGGVLFILSLSAAISCGSDTPGGQAFDGGPRVDGGAPDGGVVAPADGGVSSDGGVLDGGALDGGAQDGGGSDGGSTLDGGATDGGAVNTGRESIVVECPNPPLPAPPSGQTCAFIAGSDHKLLQADILAPGRILKNGQLLVDNAGRITCADCSCASVAEAATATRIECPSAVVSPGLINLHDHLNWANVPPSSHGTIRYDHRNDWRDGKRGHTALNTSGSSSTRELKAWGELRFAIAGATSTAASSSADFFVRNLDNAADEDGLGQPALQYETFPLENTSSYSLIASGCTYPAFKAPSTNAGPYLAHVAEGIDNEARNEFLCLTDTTLSGGHDISRENVFVHAIGLKAIDAALMAARGTTVVWNPRTNTSLYGMGPPVTMFHRMGVNLAVGTDWLPSGSMNMLRELACAAQQNRDNYNIADPVSGARRAYFSDEDLVKMVTLNAARAAKMDDVIGALSPGLRADVVVWNASARSGYSAIVGAHPRDIALSLKEGRPVYGDAALLEALGSGDGQCERINDAAPEDCLNGKRVCVQREYGDAAMTYVRLSGMFTRYRAFYCGEPPNEPTCTPLRNNESNDGIVYDGLPKDGDKDGDGVPDAQDNCPLTFNPQRPVDNFRQADHDGDGVGDACDPCPLDANTTTCSTPNPDDRDGDGKLNAADNCPEVANPDQLDTDNDGKGDACDLCPMEANPGNQPCTFTVYSVKRDLPLGTFVRLHEVLVTAKATNGFVVTVPPLATEFAGPDYSSIFIFTNTAPAVNPGDVVTLQGRIAEFRAQRQLDNVSGITIVTSGVELPAPVVISDPTQVAFGGSRAAALEGSLVRVGPVTVLAVTPSTGRFNVTGPLIVSNTYFQVSPLPPVGDIYQAVTGLLRVFDQTYQVEPRAAGDLQAGPPRVSAIEPAVAFANEGVPLGMRVVLNRAVEVDTTISLSGGANLAVLDMSGAPASSVLIAAGQFEGLFQVLGTVVRVDDAGTAAVGTTETVTAMLDGRSVSASVRIVAAGEVPNLASLQPEVAGTVVANTTSTLIVGLTVPATAGGVVVGLAVDQNGSVPTSVTVPEGQATARFSFTAGMADGVAKVTATLGTTTREVSITVTTQIRGGLVLNEVDYDQPGTDTGEFVEIYNGTGALLNVANYSVVFINGANNAEYSRVNLEGTLNPGQYFVVAGPNVTVPADARVLRFSAASNNVQNGSPDGVALFDRVNKTLIDSLCYGGAMTAVTINGGNNPYNLVRGAAAPSSVSDNGTDATRSLVRCPNGSDSGNSSVDWKAATGGSPGAANACP
jgi:imidazolonepropionase-like amidohydrolase